MIYSNVCYVGGQLGVRGYRDDGKPFQKKVNYKPTLFLSSNGESPYKTIFGKSVSPTKFESMTKARKWIKRMRDIANLEVAGNDKFINAFISDYWKDEVLGGFDDLRCFVIDIETETENGFPDVMLARERINCISIYDTNDRKIHTFLMGEFESPFDDVVVYRAETEAEMLALFVGFWVENCPDIVTGWNTKFFDIPYLVRRITRIIGEDFVEYLSPWKMIDEAWKIVNDKEQLTYNIKGVAHLDYLDLYKKFPFPYNGIAKLDYVTEMELGVKKVDYSENMSFKEFYTSNFQKFVEYNIQDVRLIVQLNDKKKLLELAVMMGYMAKTNFEDVFSPVNMWDAIIFNHLRSQKIVIPMKKQSKKSKKYTGAYVKEPILGRYDWMLSYDLNSLYPSIIRLGNISPETLTTKFVNIIPENMVDGVENFNQIEDKTIMASGNTFDSTVEGFMPYLMKYVCDQRVEFKKESLKQKRFLEEINEEVKRRQLC